ncbi:MAG: RdgB/HAM1 family non-canonical purine NTP pyrophosphatase [Actinomycetaceae bacterium]|nr:RdgB/HAM1 family non-canonical purine NTP pyrophosphatase [Actinomycetaceae bacterium]
MSHYSLVLATGNAHKVRELFAILSPLVPELSADSIGTLRDFDVPEPVEDAPDFAGNALLKARALAHATGLPCVADDSGLCVDILGGAPGIFSARWCGRHGDDEANLALLLAQLADVPAKDRGARFTCAAALVTPAGDEHVEIGHMIGHLVTEPRGNGGFGYDPIFIADGQHLTNAELGTEKKNAISHRAHAFAALAPVIASALQA